MNRQLSHVPLGATLVQNGPGTLELSYDVTRAGVLKTEKYGT